MHVNDISGKIIGCAIEVHRELGGPGLLESVYEEALCHELTRAGMKVERQKRVPITYKGLTLATPLVVDVLVEDQIVVENKAVAEYNDIFEVQCRTYLRLLTLQLGLVLNFGERYLKDGVHRVANNLV